MKIATGLFTASLLAASIAVLASAPASSQSLEARKMQAREDASLADKLALTNKSCDSQLTARIDWNSFDADEALKKGVVAWCQAGLDAIEDLCGDPLGKKAVNEKLKSLTCTGAAEPSATLVDGDVNFLFSLTPNQNKMLVRTYLEKHL
jgi:hypothetical protein